MSFAVGTVCYETAPQAAAALCATQYPQTFGGSASAPLVVSCAGAEAVSGAASGVVRLQLASSNADAAPTLTAVQVQMPSCEGLDQHGAAVDWSVWGAMFIACALGFIGGQQR